MPKPEILAANNPFVSGKFLVDSKGQVGIDFVFDGGLFRGQLAIVSLKGMEKFVPGSEEFIKEVASRALSNSQKGHVVINDLSEGAKFTGNLPEGNYNDGSYLGVKTFAMTPGEEFGVMLVPNGTVEEVLKNPAIGGDKRPLFSMATANPNQAFQVGQIADVTGDGNTFAMEDMRVDLGSDRDYNDFVFQVRGAKGQAVNLDSVINAEKDWRKMDMGKALIAYAKPYVELKVEPKKEDEKPVNNTGSGSVLDVPIPDVASASKDEDKKAIAPVSTSTKDAVALDKAVVSEVKVEEDKKAIVTPVSTFSKETVALDKAVVSEVKVEEDKKAIAPVSTSTKETVASDKAVVSEVKAEEDKKAIAPVYTSTKDVQASDKTVTTVIETETKTVAPQPAPKNLSTLETETNKNQPQPTVTSSPQTDGKPAIPTQEVAQVSQPIAHDSKPAIHPQELSAISQSIATDSKPVNSTPEVAKPAIATNSQPAIFLQQVAPVTQPIAPNAIITIATNSQEKTNAEPINPAQNVGFNPVATATSFHSPKASQPLVGIISTGFNANNFDIDYSRITLGKDRIANDDNPLIKSGEGSEQGTHVLGLIAATQNNSKGIDGINNEAPIWLGRASGNNNWAESLIEFVDTAKKSAQSNAVVTISFELTQVDASNKIVPRYELTEAEQNALQYARKNQVVVVVPAGNNPQEISALGKASLQFDNIITVGASSGGQVTDYSGTGKGLDILTEGGTLNNPVRSTVGESTGLMAGTSVAAAQVTGAISQVWAANSLLNYQQVLDIVKRTATDIALPNWDAKTGAGLLNLAAAVPLAKATEAKPLPPEATVQDIVSQINNLAPELDNVLEQFNNQLQQISTNPDSALIEPKPEDEKQVAQELDALIADFQKEIDDLQNDPFADVDGIASAYQFDAKDQPLIGIIDTGFAENNPD